MPSATCPCPRAYTASRLPRSERPYATEQERRGRTASTASPRAGRRGVGRAAPEPRPRSSVARERNSRPTARPAGVPAGPDQPGGDPSGGGPGQVDQASGDRQGDDLPQVSPAHPPAEVIGGGRRPVPGAPPPRSGPGRTRRLGPSGSGCPPCRARRAGEYRLVGVGLVLGNLAHPLGPLELGPADEQGGLGDRAAPWRFSTGRDARSTPRSRVCNMRW